MRAAQIIEYNKPYQLCEVPVPECGDHDLLVEVFAAGFCHSDVQVLQGQFVADLPMIPSHEPAGRIVKVGSQVQDSWKVGDRVGVLNFKNACRTCVGCLQHLRRHSKTDPRFCQRRQMAGFKHDGAFAQYMLADPETTIPLPDGISFEQGAPLMCAGATAWGALQKLLPDVQPGEAVAVAGIGGVGHLAIQLAKAMGFKTVAIDNRDEGCQLASDLPAHLRPDQVVNSSHADAHKTILDFTAGEGLAGIVVCMDSVEANAWCVQQLGARGVMVPLGLPKEKWRFDSEAMVFNELTIRGSYVSSAEQVKDMLEIVAEKDIRSHLTILDFDQIPDVAEAFADKSRKGRLVIRIGKDNTN
ncbi:alcohol dehydrogenase GroES-like domain-containing protein [Aaosphaeria arxii CBS 175.79]|uniref:Alcohol dehydrogenase GroES-like domain-containing protein n=1 Tax=Aaosphaeria arxii CBS 175.79 TaxID=1450172 RepID=A0A6A5XX73_9PLEO|nr:alcohol dehydrogenase GroES-like domain-containing protein [Aaosphaeria arxii CBS 175.79]KAF2017925.1 alcohol dehydrogenase GroES-like domain-containing protein [Aaosphaeria arxii CBS 175.79]